jgi:NADH-quinone oxidoreductase subunit N
MATVVKAAGFIAFMRLFNDSFGNLQPQWKLLVSIIVAITLFIGNITAVFSKASSGCWRIPVSPRRAL